MTCAPLPSWALDVIAYGVDESPDDRRPVFRATHHIACSAIARGWTETQFYNQVKDGINTGGRKPSTGLWQQLTSRRNKSLRSETYLPFLSRIWAWATANVSKGHTPRRQEEIDDLVEGWKGIVRDNSLSLMPSELKIIEYIIEETEEKKFFNVTCPGRHIEARKGVHLRTVFSRLVSLRERGIIICKEIGEGKRGSRKASIYSLPGIDPLLGLPKLPSLPVVVKSFLAGRAWELSVTPPHHSLLGGLGWSKGTLKATGYGFQVLLAAIFEMKNKCRSGRVVDYASVSCS